MARQIIGLCGFIGSGKDTVADYLVEQHGYTRESFAKSLKHAVSAIFGWNYALVEGVHPESRIWRDEVDTWWAKRLNIPHLTPRWVLQNFGTNVCREHFHQDIWLASVEHRIRHLDKVVITDCRFKNEIAMLQQNGAIMTQIVRGEDPVWCRVAQLAANGEPDYIKEMNGFGVHRSEWDWLSTNFDYILENNGTKAELYKLVDSTLNTQHK